MADFDRNALDPGPPAVHGRRPSETVYGPFGDEYGVDYVERPPISALLGARFGFRGAPQAKFPGPWAAERPPAQGPVREWKQSGDDSVGQRLLEAATLRVRQPGEAVAQKDSSGWSSHLIAALLAGAAGYGGWNWAGGSEALNDLMKDDAEERRAAVEAHYDLPHNKYNLHGSTRPFGTGQALPPPSYTPYKP